MDNVLTKELDELLLEFKASGTNTDDPVAKLMYTVLLHQARKIRDEISSLPGRIVERLSNTFVPKNKIDALPALCMVQPSVRIKRDMAPHVMSQRCSFSYKVDTRQSLTYYPLFRNLLLPLSEVFLMTPNALHTSRDYVAIRGARKGEVWLGLEVTAEIETLENVSFLIRGTAGVLPDRIVAGNGDREISFISADNMDAIPMAEPFDSQQIEPGSMGFLSGWQRILAGNEGWRLIYINDSLRDRDVFKCKAYPRAFQQFLESNDLDRFNNNTLWLLFDFGPDYDVPEKIEILPNVMPVANIGIGNVTLTQSSPIEKLTKNDGSSFLAVIETPLSLQKQGFSRNEEEFVIRDFDAAVYDAACLQRDVRNLYNRFIDDYQAFVNYHGLKDGELVRSLREIINRIGKNVNTLPDNRNRFDEGTYAMRSVALSGQITPVKVSYMTTFGRLGNVAKEGTMMENKKDVALEKEVRVVVSAQGGEDKAAPDQMYELLRYYTLTADRLYTRMDIDAYIRMRLLKEFGKEETRRISYQITVQGAGGPSKLMRGLYIDIRFKDSKNYNKALAIAFDRMLRREIEERGCFSMPLIVTLSDAESGK